mgnify:CR=1 FL=1|tara:strand:- start:847 stop:2022 length:1176 start_codon:yes stop_codon:yes gene_type:complete
MAVISPSSVAELSEIIVDAMRDGRTLEIRGGGSKAEMGRGCEAGILCMGEFKGVVDYDPAELVLTVRAGTPLRDVEALVASERQMLAFDPWDHGPIFGRLAGSATIGGVIAAAVAGSNRLTMGGARDHLLGFEAVSGRGEPIVGGAKVVKNVTGYDIPKLMAGSWGRLAALTQITLKVLPRPVASITVIIDGLDVHAALTAMTVALQSQAGVAAAAHLPADVSGGYARTLFRIQGFRPSVEARTDLLKELMRDHGQAYLVEGTEADNAWFNIRSAAPLNDGRSLWRINIPPSRACTLVSALEPMGARWFLDWAGGLVWLSFDGDPQTVRAAADSADGHAMLVRSTAEIRASVPMQHPRPASVNALESRIRRAFDPSGVFETGRFLDVLHAD